MTTRRDFILSVAADTDEYVKKMQALGGLTEKEAKKLGTLFASEQIKAQNIAAKAAMEAAKKAENAWDKANDEVQKGTQQTASKLQGLKKIAEGMGFSGAVNDMGDLVEGAGLLGGGLSAISIGALALGAAIGGVATGLTASVLAADDLLKSLEEATGLPAIEFVTPEELARIEAANLSFDALFQVVKLIPIEIAKSVPWVETLGDSASLATLAFVDLIALMSDGVKQASALAKYVAVFAGGVAGGAAGGLSGALTGGTAAKQLVETIDSLVSLEDSPLKSYLEDLRVRLNKIKDGIKAVKDEARKQESRGSRDGAASDDIVLLPNPESVRSGPDFLPSIPDGFEIPGTTVTDAFPGFRGAEEQIGRIGKRSKETQKEITQSGLALGAQLAGQLSGAIGAVMDGLTDRIERLQAQHREIIEQSRNLELDYLSELEQATLAGDERKAAAAAKNLEMIEEERNRKIKAIEEEEMRRKKAAKAVFAVQKALSIAEVAFNTAIGITSAFALTNPILIAIQTAAVASIGAAQIASILAQPPPFHRGGYVEGGLASDEKLIRARAGEYVLNPAATAQIGKQNLDAMNRGQGMAQTIVVQQVYTHRALDIVMADHLRLNTNLSRAIRGTRRVGQNLAPIRTHTGAA